MLLCFPGGNEKTNPSRTSAAVLPAALGKSTPSIVQHIVALESRDLEHNNGNEKLENPKQESGSRIDQEIIS